MISEPLFEQGAPRRSSGGKAFIGAFVIGFSLAIVLGFFGVPILRVGQPENLVAAQPENLVAFANAFRATKVPAAPPSRIQFAQFAGGGAGNVYPAVEEEGPSLPYADPMEIDYEYDPTLDSPSVPWTKDGEGAMPGGCSFCMG